MKLSCCLAPFQKKSAMMTHFFPGLSINADKICKIKPIRTEQTKEHYNGTFSSFFWRGGQESRALISFFPFHRMRWAKWMHPQLVRTTPSSLKSHRMSLLVDLSFELLVLVLYGCNRNGLDWQRLFDLCSWCSRGWDQDASSRMQHCNLWFRATCTRCS